MISVIVELTKYILIVLSTATALITLECNLIVCDSGIELEDALVSNSVKSSE